MIIKLDPERGKELIKLLYETYTKTGIFGKKEMPEDILPKGMTKGSREHVLFITFTVSIDYQRKADELWESARRTYEDPETRYLFYPEKVYESSFEKIKDDIKKHNLSWREKKRCFNLENPRDYFLGEVERGSIKFY
ncbi:hypothetical protein [Thermodesulfobacterium geofontis]|jgi:hypothetical protein|uniref:hypothetical protein n=1 Tax=Thermodesulfobacterium geofontis TaxID=1295609 RepID=UPI0002F27CD0|nr:hypothetical protein [Thermodesulfobacterium geofontis]